MKAVVTNERLSQQQTITETPDGRFEAKKVVTLLLTLLVSCSLFGQSLQNRPSKWAQPEKAAGLKNAYRLNDSIYRCAQPDSAGLEALHKLKVRTVLNLRTSHSDNPAWTDPSMLLLDVRMSVHDQDTDQLIKALRVLHSAPKPIVVHCRHGSDRTGLVLAMYRIVFEGWSRAEAIHEMVEGGYGFHTKYQHIVHYLETFDIDAVKSAVCPANLCQK